MLGAVLLASLLLVRVAGGPFTRMRTYLELALMGAAFLLLETKSIVQFALLFGTTRFVNSLVSAGVLLAVYLAVETARWVRLPPAAVLYGALIVAPGVAWIVPQESQLGLPAVPRFLAASALAFAPVFLANLVFAQRFSGVESAGTAFAANLLGAMVGGTLEYVSLITGYQFLLIVAAVLCSLAFITGRRRGSAAQLTQPRDATALPCWAARATLAGPPAAGPVAAHGPAILTWLAAATLSAMATDVIPPFADDAFRRVLCVVAHPDDVEYGVSSAVAAWTARGVEVAYLLLTRGEAGMDSSPPERTAPLRTEEQIAGSQAVGVAEVEFLDHPDGVLEYSLGLRRDIARVIRRRKPDAVVAGSWDVEVVIGLNQADHRVAGLAAVDALRDAANRWVFPELLDEGLEPHSVRWLLVGGDPRPTHGVDVTGEPVERGIASLEAHAQYLAGIPGHPPPRPMITGITRLQGRAMGVPNAVLFRAWDFHAPPPIAAEALAAAQDG